MEEFHCISLVFDPSLHDLAKMEILKTTVYQDHICVPHPNLQHLWENVPICHNKKAFGTNCCNATQGARLAPPEANRLLNINCWAQFALHHGCIGSENPIIGLAMDQAFRVY